MLFRFYNFNQAYKNKNLKFENYFKYNFTFISKILRFSELLNFYKIINCLIKEI